MLSFFSKSVKQQEDHRTCPYCGQNKIPFKMGICICGKQVGDIQYIENTVRFAQNQYSSLN